MIDTENTEIILQAGRADDSTAASWLSAAVKRRAASPLTS